MKSLIIGAGEIGTSLFNVLKTAHEVKIRDVEDLEMDGVEVLNICYPYSDAFVEVTNAYIEKYKPTLVIIHSTVKIGTTREIGEIAVHSPCHGKHPNLEEGLKAFKKFIGGEDIGQMNLAHDYLNYAGIRGIIVESPETSELSKILCTTYYGWNLIFMKEVAKICERYGASFDEVYTLWNTYYNEGYQKLGQDQFTRPVLKNVEGKIGGHCVIPNCDLIDSIITNIIKVENQDY